MQAVILAGGLGIRLRPLTYRVPKSMVPILDKPYLYYQLEFLSKQGIPDILILTGYLGNQIEEYFKDGSYLGLRIRYCREREPVGTGGALRNAWSLLEEKFFIIYGDSFLPINYSIVEDEFLKSGKEALVVVYDNRNKEIGVQCNITINSSSLVTNYSKKKPYPELRYIDAGVLTLKKEVLKHISKNKRVVSFEEEIFPVLIQKRKLIAYITRQRFYDIGTQERMKQFEEFLKNDYFQNTI